jgi:phosphoribosylformimino-5-aminoimidazole carboxamide ribotide isomerase
VVQIVGSTLSEAGQKTVTNYESTHGADFYARMYRADGLEGGHVIMLGPGNADAAAAALAADPGGLQLGGGITPDNAHFWLDKGAQKLIVTSWVFEFGEISRDRLAQLNAVVNPEHLVLDLSCVRRGDDYVVAINRWQTLTSMVLSAPTLEALAAHCSEFLIHAVDVEGKQQGIDGELVSRLARW